MKKQYIYIALLAFFVLMVSFVVIRYKSKTQAESNSYYSFIPRKGNAADAEFNAAKNSAEKLIEKIKANPADNKSSIALANAYIMEARVSGNVAYYDKAAMQTVDKILTKDPNYYEAWLLKALIQLSQHHFAEGLSTAEGAAKTNPNHAFVYGLLIDANVEMGNYQAALDAAEKMISIRPDLRSYSRIAYLREIYGDYPGAVDAMKMAVDAGIISEESTEWCRTQLGRLYENMGETDMALLQYQLTLAARPGYAYALAGLGRISSWQKKYDSAVYYYQQAAGVTNDPGIRQNLAMAYRAAGQTKKADAMNAEVIDEMTKNAKKVSDDPGAGHYSDKEQAYAYMESKNYEKALIHAIAEYNRRPKNIEVNETVAWVYYKINQPSLALPYVEKALVTKSRNPLLLCLAGMVYIKTGNVEKGRMMLEAALRHNPVLPEDIHNEAVLAIKQS